MYFRSRKMNGVFGPPKKTKKKEVKFYIKPTLEDLIEMKQELIDRLDKELEELEGANALNIKSKAKTAVSTVREIIVHQAKVNSAIYTALQDGLRHRDEMQYALENIKQAIEISE